MMPLVVLICRHSPCPRRSPDPALDIDFAGTGYWLLATGYCLWERSDMLDITTGLHRNCDRISRRDCLQVGALTALGLGLGDWLSLEAARADGSSTPTADAVILLWLGGGMSQIDTFDPKPDAPPEIRGHFGSIPT